MLSGDREKASQAWKKALELNPANETLRRYVEFVQEAEVAFEEPFKITLKGAMQGAPKDLADPEAAYVYLLDQEIARVNKDGTASRYAHIIAKITNQKGVESFDTYPVWYSAGEEKVRVLGARVVRKDGKLEEAVIRGTGEDWGEGEWRRVVIDFPTLEVGDVVEVEYKKSATKQGFFGDYFGDVFYFGSENRSLRSQYALIAPIERKFYFHQRNCTVQPVKTASADGKFTVYSWEMLDVPKVQSEPSMPDLAEVVPLVQVSTYGDWKEFGKWYWSLIKRQFDMNDEMRKKLVELTEGKKTTLEKIRAVYNFVVTDIRYEAWEFGIHGFKPYRASQIFAQKHGDCKDKSLMINVFLRELGIDSRPVLIRGVDGGRSEEDLELPMVQHFNHAISYVRLEDGSDLWLDGTAEYHEMDWVPTMDMGGTAAVVFENGAELKTLPFCRSGDNVRRDRSSIRLAADGTADMKSAVSTLGPQAMYTRYYFGPLEQEKRIEKMGEILGRRFGRVEISGIDFSNLNDLDKKVEYTYSAAIPNFLQERSGGWAFKPVISPEGLSNTCSKASRTYDVILGVPMAEQAEVDFVLPEGFKVRHIPEGVSLDTKFGKYSAELKESEGTVHLSKTFFFDCTRVSTADYAQYRDFCNKIDAFEELEVLLEKK
jgi:hypothetical protein